MPYQKKVAVGKGKLNISDYMSPLKMFEYLASNVPFISSDLPVLREVLTDGVNCFLVEADNVNQRNDALREIISSSDIRDKVIMNQKSTVKDYSWKKRAQKISRFINQKINESV